jgi:hypothetical protein
MSVSRHHADWLSLVEVSGPFLSLPVLMRVFPQGLEPRDPAQAKLLRDAYGEWQDNPAAPGKQRAWVIHVLTAILGYPQDLITESQNVPAGMEASMPEMGETLRPDFALIGPAGSDTAGQAQLLIASYPADQALGKPVIGKHWKATPTTRMMELLHGAGVPLGLVTNGEEWMLVYAPRGETTGHASWYAALWLDEPITLRAFHSLLGARRFFGVAADSTLLALLKESANDQQEVTDQLGYQVREAVEVLVQSLDALDKESDRTLLKGVSETALYDAALTIMMRLVFLFSAEERDLLHLGKPLYDDNYAVSTLQEQLQEVADRYGEEVLERRYDAWARLLASFRAVHGGIQHQDLLMQAYGGSLFDPDRYPFLEGRAAGSAWRSTVAEPLAVNNRVVLHLLNSLQRLRIKAGAGGAAETRRVSFRALGVEQIGHVYEGLLDHTAVRAAETVLGIKGTRSKEAEIPLATLESLQSQGRDKLIEFLKEETGRSVSAIRRTLEEGSLRDQHKLFIACGQDETLLDRLRPFVGLIRVDSFERPLVVLPGGVYVTVGSTRRSTGTHYTPPSLTEPIVQYTLEPLVYEGPPDGWPREQWKLKPPKAILDLKVCDMTMGSGAFLVQACRYLAERLVEAWENAEAQHPGEVLITPDGTFSEGSPSERLVPADASERIAIARRVVADRCLYGVDINPMAVEMAKLSLWLITVDRDRPFTFLDHAFKCGDSLLGITSLEQLENFSLRPDVRQGTFATVDLVRQVEQASAKRRALEDLPSNDHDQIEAKNCLYTDAEAATAKVKALADCLIAMEVCGVDGNAYNAQRTEAAEHAEVAMRKSLPEFQAYARAQLRGHRTFHWLVEFPEVFARCGFDAFIGNPPFVGGRRMRQSVGDESTESLRLIWPHASLNADLCAFFFLRAAGFLRSGGCFGLLATKTIGQGDTARTGLAYLLNNQETKIVAARSSFEWPGTAAVIAAFVVACRGQWHGAHILDDRHVSSISAVLDDHGTWGDAKILRGNFERSFQGSVLVGLGFVLNSSEAQSFLSLRAENSEVIHPYLGGEDLNTHPMQEASRWAIDFRDYDLARCEQRWPELLDRIRRLVKPQRDVVRREAHRRYWWHHGDKRPELYSRIRGREGVFVIARVTKYVTIVRVRADQVFHDKVYVFDIRGWGDFSCLQSSLHDSWVRRGSSTVGETLNYTPSDYFDTFPFLHLSQNTLQTIGSCYHESRHKIVQTRQEGLTKIYNRFHDPEEKSEDIGQLRALQVDMDRAVAAAYGWRGLDLGHDFYEIKQGVRYTISEAARRKVLDRLLALNHERYAEEEAELRAQLAPIIAKRGRKKQDARDQILIEL